MTFSAAMSEPYLLDRHIVLFALGQPESLTSSVRAVISEGRNVLSTAVYWEVGLKSGKGKLDVGDVREWWKGALDQLGATVLPTEPRHIEVLVELPLVHRDPFDHVLIAQAMVEGLTLISADEAIAGYVQPDLRLLQV